MLSEANRLAGCSLIEQKITISSDCIDKKAKKLISQWVEIFLEAYASGHSLVNTSQLQKLVVGE